MIGEILKCQALKYAMLGSCNLGKKSLKSLLGEHYQLIGVLVVAFLVMASRGTYVNWDAELEFEAASSVVTRGFPFVTAGLMINQPPLGFYLDAPVFQTFGLSYVNGVNGITAFAFACIILVYALGTLLYGKRTGLVAAALFGVVPWHVFMSRIFLIDIQALFFSLLFLILGVLAVRRNSEKLVLVSGIVFALAFMTKLFAVFMLVPLLLIIFFQRKEVGFKLTHRKALVFLVPSFVLQAVWFGGLANQHFFGVYFSSDFTHPELIADPSVLFWPATLVASAGWFLLIAGVFSLALSVCFRKFFAKRLWLDVVCVGTIAAVAASDLLLVFGFHLIVPYISVVKYNYMALPFFCLLAASLADKSRLLIGSMGRKGGIQAIKPFFVGVGLVLLFASLVESMVFLAEWDGFVSFGPDSVNYFPFFVHSGPSAYFLEFHYIAIVSMILSITFPFMAKWFKRRVGWLSMAQSTDGKTNP